MELSNLVCGGIVFIIALIALIIAIRSHKRSKELENIVAKIYDKTM